MIQGEKGATNFITGSGGFLQTILNGYAGIKIFIDRLEIRNPRLPYMTDNLRISGIMNNNKLTVFFEPLGFLIRK